MEFSGFNPEVLSGRIRKIQSVAQEYLSEPPGDSVIDEWVGFRPMSYDDLPIIGRPVKYKNLCLWFVWDKIAFYFSKLQLKKTGKRSQVRGFA